MSILLLLALILLIVAIAAALYLIVYQKVLAPVKPGLLKLDSATIIYAQYQGNYNKMMDFVNGVKRDFQAYCDSEGIDFAKYPMVGIYYDDPNKLLDIKMGRAVVGILLLNNNKKDTEAFNEKKFLSHPTEHEFKVVSHGSIYAFGAHFPLVGLPSLLSAIVRGYPKIKKFGIDRGLMNKCVCSYEIYEWSRKKMTVCFPYGDEPIKKLNGLSGFPQPTYKSQQ